MRLELAGSIVRANPVTKVLENGVPFIPQDWIDLGYTHFDVICIGGGGGHGGGVDTANTGTLVRNYGGEGGGGGYQRIQGMLSALPSSCPIVVGASGAAGTTVAVGTATSDGTDGGYSSFNGITCRASGGKGGKRAQTNAITGTSQAHGGAGGIGNTTAAGGGGLGGVCGTIGSTLSTDGEDGPIIDDIGHGGGGGAGGIAKYGVATSYLDGSAGGNGSWNPDDVLVSGDGEDVQPDPGTGVLVKPGRGGGANASPLNGLPYNFGQAGTPGTVVIRLTSR